MKTLISTILIIISLFAINNNAWSEPVNSSSSRPLYQVGYKPCWDQAGAYHNIDPWLLYAIASVESKFNPIAHNKNTNGTIDFGMMQINSIHFPELRKFGIPFQILADRCGSTYVGAWILSRTFKQCGRNWNAIAAYNTGRCNVGAAYAAKVAAAYKKYAPRRNNFSPTPNRYTPPSVPSPLSVVANR